MIARSIHQIFKKLEHNIDIEYSVRVSHMEIYNEELIDLLAPEGNDAKTLKMLEHPTNGVCVHNLQEEAHHGRHQDERAVVALALHLYHYGAHKGDHH